jgi:tetratricopeptide (TPR) repeat protein
LVATLTAAVVVAYLLAGAVGWAGYVSTTRALARAKANVDLSLTAFDDLFRTLTDPWDRGPFGEEPPDGPPPGGAGRPLPRRPGPPQEGPPEFGPGGPKDNPAVLETVLAFYDKFAAQNETDSHLQGEAARALRKVAALYRSLDKEAKASDAHARVTATFERLVTRNSHVPEYRYELARTYALDDQHPAEPTPPEEMEHRLRNALKLVTQLDEESPGTSKYVAALARWKAQLGAVLQSLHRPEEAERSYRESIEHDEWLAGHVSKPALVRQVLAVNRGELARVLLQVGRRDEAKALLDRSSKELEALADEEPSFPHMGWHLTESLARMAETYQELGETGRAEALGKRVAAPRPRRGPGFGPPPGGGGRPPHRGPWSSPD